MMYSRSRAICELASSGRIAEGGSDLYSSASCAGMRDRWTLYADRGRLAYGKEPRDLRALLLLHGEPVVSFQYPRSPVQ